MSHEVSRRQMLRLIPAGVGMSGVANLAQPQEYRIAEADLKLGIASYSFRKFKREQAIQMTKQLGTPYLNIKPDAHLPLNSTPEEIAAAKKEFDEAGIVLVGCGTVYFLKDDEAEMRRNFEYAKRVGFPLIVAGPTQVTLPKLEKFVKEFDIKVAVHNHGPEDKYFPTSQSVLKIVKDLDPRMGCCIDIGHTARTGVNVVDAIAEAGPRLLDMHIKDLEDPATKESQVPVGAGKLPIAGVFKQLINMKYAHCVNLEYEIDADNPMPGMQKSFSYMRGVLAGLQAAHSG
ncbi:MAG: sugar phosphate isomerase/epimerase [Acidobacteriaceae bacterium]|nr:sugar phosphate isomerase/epimerase [Acidobacteriaceae bacterium]